MSMYLPNDDVQPTGAEGAEFIDTPMPAVDAATEDDDEVGSEDDDRGDGDRDGAERDDDEGEGQETS